MTLESIFDHVQTAADELRDILKEEGKPTTYVFFYEQTGDEEEYPGVWWPNYRYIDGHDIEEAFGSFGHILKVSGLVVCNISYGPEHEMRWAIERVSRYWDNERARKERQEQKKTAP